MGIHVDLKKGTYEFTGDIKGKIEKDLFRAENYFYCDKFGREICSKLALVHKSVNLKLVQGINGNSHYNQLYMSYLKSLEYIDYSKIEEIMPPLLYNLKNVLKGVENNENIYFVENECFANYLNSKGLIATTTLTDVYEFIENRAKYLKYLDKAKIYLIDSEENIFGFDSDLKENLKSIASKFTILSDEKDFIKEFGKDSTTLNIIQGYDEHLKKLEKMEVWVDLYYQEFVGNK